LIAADLIRRGLPKARIDAEELPRLGKGHPLKVRLVRDLRQHTTLTLREIAALLGATGAH
jgi:hypothetical protein